MTFTHDFINVRWGLRCDGFITSLGMIGEPSHWPSLRHVQGWDYSASKFRYTIYICRCSRFAVQLYAPSQSVGYSYCDRALWKSHQQSIYETICSMRNSAEAAWCSVFLLYCLVVSECIQPIAFVCSQQAHLYMCVSITSDSIASLPLLLCFWNSCVNCLCCFHCPLTEETCLTILFYLCYLLLAVLNVELLVVSFLDLFTLSCSISFVMCDGLSPHPMLCPTPPLLFQGQAYDVRVPAPHLRRSCPLDAFIPLLFASYSHRLRLG